MPTRFFPEVIGPFDAGAMMVVFCRFISKSGELATPDPPVRVACFAPGGEFLTFLTPGSKGEGLCEFAPIQGNSGSYRFQVETMDGEIISPPAFCDQGKPIVPQNAKLARKCGIDATEVFVHKSWVCNFFQSGSPEPPLAGCEPYRELLTSLRDLLDETIDNFLIAVGEISDLIGKEVEEV